MTELAEQFAIRSRRLMREALELSRREDNDYTAFNRYMGLAKSQNLTYVEGLCYTVETLRQRGL